MSESTVSLKFNYEHDAGRTPTPGLSMVEFIAQVKDKMVDKVNELEVIGEMVKNESSPIAAYGKLIDYQLANHYPYYNVKDSVIPKEIFRQIMEDIFSYVKEGVIGEKFENITFCIGNLEFEIGTEHTKFLKVQDNSEYHIYSELGDWEVLTPYEKELFEELKSYFEEKEKDGRKRFLQLVLAHELEKKGNTNFVGKLWGKAITSMYYTFHSKDIQTIYKNLRDKDENFRIRKDKIETWEKENIVRDAIRERSIRKYRLDLVIEAFKEEGFEIKYVNIEYDGEINFH